MRALSLGAGLGLVVALVGCSTGPNGTGRLTVQLSGRSTAAAVSAFAPTADVLVISTVQVVARKIKLERAEGTCPADAPAPSSTETPGDTEESEDCPVLWLEPRLLEPPVDATAQAIFSVDLPEGTYEEIKLQIHKPTDAGADAQFLQAHPEFAGLSIKVTGTFNGTPFTFTSALTSEVEITLDAPVEVGSAAPTSVTLQIDLNSWFAAESGGVLNPIQPSQDVRSRIEQNIRRSFHAFEDDDHNGKPD